MNYFVRNVLISIFFLCLMAFGTGGNSQTVPATDLTRDQLRWESIAPVLFVYRDETGNLGIEGAKGANFTPLGRKYADFGYTTDAIWLRFDVINRAETSDFVLALRTNFLPLYQVWIAPEDGDLRQVDAQDIGSVFGDRAIKYAEVSTPLTIDPGERAAVYIRYQSGGSSELSWRIIPTTEFNLWSGQRTARNFVFYGMTLLLSLAGALSWLVTRRPVFAAYSAYALSGLLFIMHADGNAFQYLWPNNPEFNNIASVPLGVLIIVTWLIFARSFLSTRTYHPLLDKILVAMIIMNLAVGLSTFIVGAQAIKQLLVLLSLISTSMLAISGLVAARTRFREVRFYVIAWTLAVIASAMMTLRHWVGIEISEEFQFNSIRIVLIVDAALMGLAILDRINWLKQSQQSALERSLAQVQKQMELNTRLQELEQKAKIYENMAVMQERNLTQTAHDIRQPLNALRLNLRRIASDEADRAQMADVEGTLSYLESLVSENLSNALLLDRNIETDQTDIGAILQSAVDMFEADATAKGISLRAVQTSHSTSVPALVLMRIVTNLVANAIHATDNGGVLVGLRLAGGLRLEVHDTGTGLGKAQFDTATGIRAKTSGLGLGIVAQLCREHGMRFERVEPDQKGTVLRVWLPTGDTNMG